MPAMLGCSTICPNCRHTFQCCPPVPCCQATTPTTTLESRNPEDELLQRLSATVRALHQSGWYYEDLTYERSDALLKDTKVGTFLVRDSSDPRYIFTLSVQTERGPRSVRLLYANGGFRLDSQPHLPMPVFPGIIELVEHYRKSRTKRDVWIDPQGKPLATIYLDRPLRKESTPPTLKHLARLSINRTLRTDSKLKFFKLGLPAFLVSYLAEYPYTV